MRGDVTVLADRLPARLRKKAGAAAPASAPPPSSAPAGAGSGIGTGTGENEIYRLEANGDVRIFTPTDHVEGAAHGIYDIDQAVLVLTGPHMVLTTPQQVMTARDAMEYWSQKHMAVGRGNAVVTTTDGRRISADTLVGYIAPDPAPPHQAPSHQAPHRPTTSAAAAGTAAGGSPAGKLERVDAFGHVTVRTATETVTGDRGVYVPASGIARLVGNVHITRGQNQLNGADAVVNLKTGISTLRQLPGSRVQGLVVPGDHDEQDGPVKKSAPAR